MRGGGGGGFRGGGGGGGMVRGGWGGGGGGIARGGWGGGVVRGGGWGGGVARGGWGGGVVRGGGWGNGFRGGFRGGFFGPRRSFIGVGFGGWPWWGFGGWGGGWGGWGGYSGWGPSYVSDVGWDPGYYGGYSAGYPAAGYAQPQSSPNVTVVYPPQAPPSNTVVLDRTGGSVIREYDQFGQEINRQPAAVTDSGPTVFLIAFRDHTIRAAAAYWVEGSVLHYVTLEHEQKSAPLNQVDRDLCVRLNRERRVVFSLPASQ
jgi:hypothetical protein